MSRVLVVEDDALVRRYLHHALERSGHHMVGAATGEEALAHLRRDPDVSAVLIDGLLPDMHGTVLARRVLEDRSTAHIPLCFITGALAGEPRMEAGVAVLAKPVRPGPLIEQLHVLEEWHRSGGSPAAERAATLHAVEAEFLVGP